MCGIVAVLRRPSRRPPPSPDAVLGPLDAALAAVDLDTVDEVAASVAAVDQSLRGVPGVRALVDPEVRAAVESRVAALEAEVARLEAGLDAGEHVLAPAALEALNAALIRLKDGLWAIRQDRLRTAAAAVDLAGGSGAG